MTQSTSENGGHGAAIIIASTERIHFGPRTILPERESDPDTSAHRIFLLLHLVHIPLLLLDLRIFGHVLDASKVVVVTGIDFGVEGRYERGPDTAQIVPFDATEEGVVLDRSESGIAYACMRYEPVFVVSGMAKAWKDAFLPRNGVPGDIAQVENQILGFVILWPPKHLRPVLQVCPSLFWCTAAEWWEASQELEEDTPKTPVVD